MSATALAAVGGWALASLLALRVLRLLRRLEMVAVAAHELRGGATAVTLAVGALRREAGGLRRALAFEPALERLRIGLADLDAARAASGPRYREEAMRMVRL